MNIKRKNSAISSFQTRKILIITSFLLLTIGSVYAHSLTDELNKLDTIEYRHLSSNDQVKFLEVLRELRAKNTKKMFDICYSGPSLFVSWDSSANVYLRIYVKSESKSLYLYRLARTQDNYQRNLSYMQSLYAAALTSKSSFIGINLSVPMGINNIQSVTKDQCLNFGN